jgi:hypothetical protein
LSSAWRDKCYRKREAGKEDEFMPGLNLAVGNEFSYARK